MCVCASERKRERERERGEEREIQRERGKNRGRVQKSVHAKRDLGPVKPHGWRLPERGVGFRG